MGLRENSTPKVDSEIRPVTREINLECGVIQISRRGGAENSTPKLEQSVTHF